MLQKKYSILGLMSGTSLDGLDIALCNFETKNGKWTYSIEKSITYAYNSYWKNKLYSVENASALDFIKADTDLGILFGKKINDFLTEFKIDKSTIHAIASHGHTIFHQPQLGFSTQIGNGAQICASTGIKTITDFRSLDIALGGQGAPLVPIGDQILFSEYDYCLNIGGIANVSSQKNNLRLAKDITFANMIGNYISEKIGLNFDENGKIAASGKLNSSLLSFLNEIAYETTKNNNSLGKETFVKKIKPFLDQLEIPIKDQLHTLAHHLSDKIAENIISESSLLITGGGAFNNFWVNLIQKKTQAKITIPSNQLIEFKEALIFAFLGVLRLEKQTNILASVTGASRNNIGGCIYYYTQNR